MRYRPLPLLGFVILAVGCAGDPPSEPLPAAVALVSVSAPGALRVGQSMALTVSTKGGAGEVLTGRVIEWSSNNAAIATVTPTGSVTAVAVGTVVVTASSEGISGSVTLDITPALVQSLTLSAPDSTFNISGTRTVVATTIDAVGVSATNKAVVWTVTGSVGAAVSAVGVVTAVRSGPVVVSASFDDKSASVTLGAYKTGFVTRLGRNFMLDGKPFFFGGSNSYWMLLEPVPATRAANWASFAQSEGRVLRIWGSYERGSADGSVPTLANAGGGLTIQTWDPVAKKPIFHEGADGLLRLDQALASARQHGVRVIISLIDNWPASGGMDQYVTWYGGTFHDEFYTDAKMKQAYKDYVNAIITRVNSVNGIKYADDQTVFAWEVANEPGCSAKQTGLGNRAGCSSANTLEPWILEMSAYIKSIDPNHLVSSGEIGMYPRALTAELGPRFNSGVWPNFDATIRMETIDFGTYHFYINEDVGSSLPTIDWAKLAIVEYQKSALAANKPTILEEFDDSVESRRIASINTVLDALEAAGGTAFLHYQFGVQKFCMPACVATSEVFPGSAAYAALKSWNQRFNTRIK